VRVDAVSGVLVTRRWIEVFVVLPLFAEMLRAAGEAGSYVNAEESFVTGVTPIAFCVICAASREEFVARCPRFRTNRVQLSRHDVPG
jgi:hypothetical protein